MPVVNLNCIIPDHRSRSCFVHPEEYSRSAETRTED